MTSKPEVPSKPSKTKFFVSPSSSNSFSQNVQSILTLNSFMPNKPSRPINNAGMDTISESGFKLSNISSRISFGSLYRNRNKPRSQSININPAKNAIDPNFSIDGAMFFLSHTNGLCGKLSFTQKSILFDVGNEVIEDAASDSSKEVYQPRCSIKDEETFKNSYEVDFLNIGDVNSELAYELYTIMIFCRDFKLVKILLKQNEKAQMIIDRIKRISFENIVQTAGTARISLWEYLFNRYQYKHISDWSTHEHWYTENFKIRISSFNEIGQCATLPETMIVSRNMNDNMLERLAAVSNGDRVPLITFLHRSSGNLIVRSTSFNDQNFQELFSKNIISPIRELAIDLILQELNDIDRSYAKLRKHCATATKLSDSSVSSFYEYEHSKQFWSKCSPWLYGLSRVMKLTTELRKIVTEEASIVLVETHDSRWNCVMSCLVQIVIDPNRRTIAGFESLLSKEWIYMTGYKSRISQNSNRYRVTHCPSTTLFIFFLDAVHQLMTQNPHMFEFSTCYLILLHDMQFVSENYKRENAFRFETNRTHISILNPFYANTDTSDPRIDYHISKMRFFYPLYFRHIKSDILKHTPEELIFLNELRKRSLL